jgi:hypothetical protein
MRQKTTSRCRDAAPPSAEKRTGGWSPEQWRTAEECIAEAYAHYARRLDDLHHETMNLLTALLERRGLSKHGSRASGRRPVP